MAPARRPCSTCCAAEDDGGEWPVLGLVEAVPRGEHEVGRDQRARACASPQPSGLVRVRVGARVRVRGRVRVGVRARVRSRVTEGTLTSSRGCNCYTYYGPLTCSRGYTCYTYYGNRHAAVGAFVGGRVEAELLAQRHLPR